MVGLVEVGSVVGPKNEAVRKRHLHSELVHWEILTSEKLDELQSLAGEGFPVPIHGLLMPGVVLVMNQWGACWTMTVTEFDDVFLAR